MSETATTERQRNAKRGNGGKREKVLGPVLVSGVRLAVHLSCTRQYVERLTANNVIERNAQGLYDQDRSRTQYIQYLRAEHRRSPRTEADAEHARAKTEAIRLRLMIQRRELVPASMITDLVQQIAGVTLTAFSSLPALLCAPGDLVGKRRVEGVVHGVRKDLAAIGQRMAAQEGEQG